ncbi:MAG TPA: GDP-mannose 4,6-dehydratase [Burkholderiaceae bacterium]|nr:GDP-mannose 4,6-dehydratase [Burkholderiaceae bacterium]
MPKALITGITGQDGILLAELLLAKGYEIVGFGRRASMLARTDLRGLMARIRVFPGDLAHSVDVADAIQHHQPDEIYNLASQSAPGMSWAQSLETGEITALGAHRLFEAARRFKADCRIYHASSSEMFGNVLETPQSERTPFNPSNPYAVAKIYAHHMAGVYRRSYGMYIACGILFNHESPYRGMRFLTQKVAYGAACAKLGIADSPLLNEEGEPVVRDGKLALGNLDAARDWGNARDYVQAMWAMLQRPAPDDYVIGTGQLRSVRDLCRVAFEHVGLDWRRFVVSDPRFVRPSETGATVANAEKARRELQWSPVSTFEATIAEMVDAHLSALGGRRIHG